MPSLTVSTNNPTVTVVNHGTSSLQLSSGNSFALSASYATTASYALNGGGSGGTPSFIENTNGEQLGFDENGDVSFANHTFLDASTNLIARSVTVNEGGLSSDSGLTVYSGQTSLDGGYITTDGSGNFFVQGFIHTDAGNISSDGNGNLEVQGGINIAGGSFTCDGSGNVGIPNGLLSIGGAGMSCAGISNLNGELTVAGNSSLDNGHITTDGNGSLTIGGNLYLNNGLSISGGGLSVTEGVTAYNLFLYGGLVSDNGLISSDSSGNLSIDGALSVGGDNFTVDSVGGVQIPNGTLTVQALTVQGINNFGILNYNTSIYAGGSFMLADLNFIYPPKASTAPSYVKGAMYFDTTLNKLRIGGASHWETVTSS